MCTRPTSCGSLRFLGFFVWMLTMVAVVAAPVLKNASLTTGFVPVRSADVGAYLNFTVENPDAEPAELTVQVEAQGNGARGAPVYSKSFTLAPHTRLSDRFPVLSANSEDYLVTLLHNQLRADKTEVVTRLQDGGRRLRVLLLNDDAELSGYSELGDSKRTPGLLQNMTIATYRAQQAPDSVGGYAGVALTVLASPELDHLLAPQQQALTDFVRQGGLLVIANPKTALAMSRSPLSALLPATPVAIRAEDGMAGLRQAFLLPAITPPERDENGDLIAPPRSALLETVPQSGSRVTRFWGQTPAVTVRREGLGTVVMLGFDPFFAAMQDKELAAPMWNHLLALLPQTHNLDNTNQRAATQIALLQQLQGFRIPPVSTIRLILCAYLGTVAFLLLLGFRLRKQGLAWTACALLAIIFTLCIFAGARDLVANQPAQSLTVLQANGWENGDLGGSACYSLFSKSDDRPSVTGVGTRATPFFQPLPQPTNGVGGKLDQSLRVNTQGGQPQLMDLAVQPLLPRPFAVLTAGAPASREVAQPTLRLTADGVLLPPFTLPEDVPTPQHAMLLLPDGIIPVTVQGRVLENAGNLDMLQADTTVNLAQQWLRSLGLRTPCVALLTAAPLAEGMALPLAVSPGNWSPFQYRIQLLPLHLELATTTFQVPAGMIHVAPANSTRGRMLFRDGEWQLNTAKSQQEGHLFQGQLPPALLDLHPREIRIRSNIINAGGNLSIEFKLAKPGEKYGQITATSAENGEFLFTDLPDGMVNPITGQFFFELTLTQKAPLANLLDGERVNSWRILSLDASVLGDLPHPAATRQW